MLHASFLEDRSAVAVAGPDARNFLQGLISNDMKNCSETHAIYAALLTPQGKILFDFFIVEREGAFLIDCASSRSADLVKRLGLYRLRAKVEIAARPDLSVATIWECEGAVPPMRAHAFADPRLPALGLRAIGTRTELASAMDAIPSGEYRAHRLSLGIPDSADLPPDTVLALDAGLEELNGVDFKKGCYVGQEVTARMKHRATARKRFVIVEGKGALPPAGTGIDAGGRDIGALATGNGSRALALVRLDRLAEAEEGRAAVTAGGQEVSLRKPAWLHV